MSKKLKGLLALAVAAIVAVVAGVALLPSQKASADTSYAYRLDFADATDFGKNVGADTYANATVTGTFTAVDAPNGGKGIQFPSTAGSYASYLSLPTAVFADTTAVTVAGWFKVPSGIADYTCELCVFSPENNKALRVDPFASGAHGGMLMVFGNNVAWTREIRPLYDTWKHVAYVVEAGKVSIYVNGALAKIIEDPNMTSPALLATATAKFYLGQNAYENSHPDYTGAMSDIRVYRNALSREQIISEYSLTYDDFLTTEFTFDDAQKPYKENVRGYDGVSIRNGDNYTQATSDPYLVTTGDQSVLRLDGTSALTMGSNKISGASAQTLDGHVELTVSLDFYLNAMDQGWAPFWDIFANNSKRIAPLSQREAGSGMDLLYGNPHAKVLTGENRLVVWETTQEQKYAPQQSWHNLTTVFSLDSIEYYLDGVLLAQELSSCPSFHTPYQILGNWTTSDVGTYFTLGSCVFRVGGERINMDCDNVRVYACALTQTDAQALTAAMREEKYTVLSYAGGEFEATSRGIGSVVELATPQKDNYVFDGWYGNAACEGEAITSVTMNADTTVYAKWLKLHTVTYVGVDGLTNANPATVTEKSGTTLVAVEKEGYTFVGWFDSETGGTQVTTLANTQNDRTLYARFTENSYALTLNATADHGSFTVTAGGETVKESTSIPFSKRNLVIAATADSGYVASVTYNGEPVGAQPDGTFIVTMSGDGTLTLGFVLVGWNLTVSYDSAMGTVKLADTVYPSGTHAFEKNYTCTVTVTAADGYFVKSVALTGESTLTPAYGTVSETLTLTLTQNAELAVVFEALNSYEIVFAANGGTGTVASISARWDEEKTLPQNAFEKTGYTFGGWLVNGEVKQAGATVTQLSQSEKTVTVTAQWTPIAYTIAFDANGAEGEIASISASYGIEANLPDATAFVYEGHTFAGWAMTEGGVVEYEAGEAVVSLTVVADDVVTLYACWTVNTYTVTVKNGADTLATETAQYRTTLTLAELVTVPEGKILTGFALTEGGEAELAADVIYTVRGDVTIYAVFADEQITPPPANPENPENPEKPEKPTKGCGGMVGGSWICGMILVAGALFIVFARRLKRSR